MSIYLHIIGYCIQCIVAAGRWKRRTWNIRKGNDGTKIQGWKLRETETTAQCCRGWKMRDMNIRERQSIESRWLLNTGIHGQRL